MRYLELRHRKSGPVARGQWLVARISVRESHHAEAAEERGGKAEVGVKNAELRSPSRKSEPVGEIQRFFIATLRRR
jgi:hypothetical protein